MSFEIDKQRPLPKKRGPREDTKYPFAEMEIGDCLIADGGPTGSTTNAKAFWAARTFREYNPWFNFTGRKLDDRPGKIGIWRIPPED